MASTGVLPFLRGIDISKNNLLEDRFPNAVGSMNNLKWLKLNHTQLDLIPHQVAQLNNLESLTITHNNLVSLHGEFSRISRMKVLNCRRNQLKSDAIPGSFFAKNLNLLVLDLSHNNYTEIPEEVQFNKQLLVLNLSHNNIDTLPTSLFMNLSDLIHLDLSHNKLETIPPQLRRLTQLQTLILNDNPLVLNQIRQLTSLINLRTLHLRSTQRNPKNLLTSLETLENLVDIDLGDNDLSKVPSLLYSLPNLKRINLSDNKITSLPGDIGDFWKSLETLNLARNELRSLPASLCKMSKLRHLYLSQNLLDFDGIPPGIGKLCNLEVFDASYNNLEVIPEGVVRCGRLKKLILSSNRLITLPDAIHLLCDIEKLDLADNPDLIMPPKPPEYQYISKGSGIEFYNIDFSLSTQLRLVGANPPQSISLNPPAFKDPTARKKRLRERRRFRDGDDEDADAARHAKVIKGMSQLAEEKERMLERGNLDMDANLKPKRWDEALEKPPLDYSDFFDSAVGTYGGLTVYEIENFVPNEVDEALHGQFYEGDCYIVLKTTIDEKENVDYQIFYWIGSQASLDKKACSAIHAVNLRNFLGARCRTIREEQAEESDEFLALFPNEIVYVEGGRTACGFFTVEEAEFTKRMFRLHELPDKLRQLYIETVALSSTSLDSRYVFLVDAGSKIYIWNGGKSKNTMKQKARLLAEKISKEERKNKSELIYCTQGEEPDDFWDQLHIPDEEWIAQIHDHLDPDDFHPVKPLVYQVVLGMGFLELPQIDYQKLLPSLLDTKCVYLVDCHTDLFIWLGRKSARLVKAAALKLGQEVFSLLKRPPYALIHRCLEGTEPQLLKTKFEGWHDVIAVDFTRTAESVQKTGANLIKWMSSQEVKVDLAALFMPRQPPMQLDEAMALIEEWNEDLEVSEAFVLEGKRFTKLPEDEVGHFFSEDCYVFLCRYWVPLDESDDEENENPEDDFQCIVFFWQGRDASNMGWLTFTFTLQKKFKLLFGDKLEVVKCLQQQENPKFLAHFKRKFLIHNGKRPSAYKITEDASNACELSLYHLRSNNSPLTLRCIQVPVDSGLLNSGFCYILKVPCDEPVIFVWIGSKAKQDEADIAEQIAVTMFDERYRVSIINEHEEGDQFWQAIGDKKEYEDDCSFMQYTRLFRCSNDKGYFSVSEKCADFCQDDLSDDDIMILDNGTQTFIWVGARCTDVEIKLAYKSAQVYVQNMRIKQPDRPRQLMLTFKGKESKKFTKCFHGWGKHKTIHDPRANVKLIMDD